MIKANIKYTTEEIERYFSTHRIRWDQFYDSERRVLAGVGFKPTTKVLDIGCGCGGLGLALAERFGVHDYTGLEINAQAAATGRKLNPSGRMLEGDFLALDNAELSSDGFDVVVSLSCIDWNVGFASMLPKAFACVRPGGVLVLSLRLSDGPTLDDPAVSFQYINYAGELKGEKASYVVLHAGDLLARLRDLGPAHLGGFGFWGRPSATAVTPAARVCFAVLVLHKSPLPAGHIPAQPLDLPADLLAAARLA